MSTNKTMLGAWKMAVKNRNIEEGLIFHSDRGVQYASKKFVNVLDSYKKITRSMSRKGNCWDNARSKSLWGSLKLGKLHGMHFETRRQAMAEVTDWLTYCNHKRLHSTLGTSAPCSLSKTGLRHS